MRRVFLALFIVTLAAGCIGQIKLSAPALTFISMDRNGDRIDFWIKNVGSAGKYSWTSYVGWSYEDPRDPHCCSEERLVESERNSPIGANELVFRSTSFGPYLPDVDDEIKAYVRIELEAYETGITTTRRKEWTIPAKNK